MSYHSHADLGGQAVQAAIVPEPEGELFHADWEPRVLALTVALGASGMWNIDMSRAARETLPDYRDLSYYEIWFAGLEKLLAQRAARAGTVPPPNVLHADAVAGTLRRGSPCDRTATGPARFTVGQRVRTRTAQPDHHTRLPAYARGKPGIVERLHGVHVFADSHAQGLGEAPQWLYTVAFEGRDIWGDDAEFGTRLSIDAWEPYLEAEE